MQRRDAAGIGSQSQQLSLRVFATDTPLEVLCIDETLRKILYALKIRQAVRYRDCAAAEVTFERPARH